MRKVCSMLGLAAALGMAAPAMPQDSEQEMVVVRQIEHKGDILETGSVEGDFNHDGQYGWTTKLATFDLNHDGMEDTVTVEGYEHGKETNRFAAYDTDHDGILDNFVDEAGNTPITAGDLTVDSVIELVQTLVNCESHMAKIGYFATLSEYSTEWAESKTYEGDILMKHVRWGPIRFNWPKFVLGDRNGDGEYDWKAIFHFGCTTDNDLSQAVKGDLFVRGEHQAEGLLMDEDGDGYPDRAVADHRDIDGEKRVDGVYDEEFIIGEGRLRPEEDPVKMEDMPEWIDNFIKEVTKE